MQVRMISSQGKPSNPIPLSSDSVTRRFATIMIPSIYIVELPMAVLPLATTVTEGTGRYHCANLSGTTIFH
ncbi:hypothetical protein SCLCIDRAFT_1221877 [Scleroderma citrinum Foug A]|uniref:Uncharacterized protein n=1 Tax=Scleroderma citrinum Foug A TaxID=1036808 RepID=A0A0C3D167_9AGAM|nr:hypothetical protein SCLCIDRAFT_1221877 [Scleroderma citrinum Foug A]